MYRRDVAVHCATIQPYLVAKWRCGQQFDTNIVRYHIAEGQTKLGIIVGTE
ncbi:hypothetical protein D3C78_1069270 [compost metagenome]